MGERYSVALLKELPDLNPVRCSINISPLRGFPTDSQRGSLACSLWIFHPRLTAVPASLDCSLSESKIPLAPPGVNPLKLKLLVLRRFLLCFSKNGCC